MVANGENSCLWEVLRFCDFVILGSLLNPRIEILSMQEAELLTQKRSGGE